MSDMFFVYTTSGSLDNPVGESFGSMFTDTLSNRNSEQLAFKVRYHLGG